MCNALYRSWQPSEDGTRGGDGCPSLGTGTWAELETQRPGAGTGPGPTAAPATFLQSKRLRLMVGAGSPQLGVGAPGFGLQLGCVHWR